MATELGLFSLTHLQKLAQSQQNKQHQPNPNLTSGAWMLNAKQDPQDDDDSWEVRAFAEDTGNIMGTTWPPRSYTCTFCRREFRSAQALGGHMNVHRRDRARLHQIQPGTSTNPTSSSSTSSSAIIIPTQEFATNGGLCLLYQLPNPNGVFTSTSMTACALDSPSTLLSISPYPHNNLVAPSMNFPQGLNSSQCYSSKEPLAGSIGNSNNDINNSSCSNNVCKDSAMEELDLELRLGHRPTSS